MNFFLRSVETYISEVRKLTWRSTGHIQLHKSKRTVEILKIFHWPLQYTHMCISLILNEWLWNTATQRKKSKLWYVLWYKQRLHEIVSDQVTILHVANQWTIIRTSTRYFTWITRLWTHFFSYSERSSF
jgi:hypothetical protein